MSKIEWTDVTWNPVTGCTPIATGCKNCYARTMHKRLRAMGQPKYSEPFDVVRCHPDELEKPLRWRKPRKVFVCSMSDLFHEDVPFGFVDKVLSVMALTPHCTYQVLTKRPERMAEYFESHKKPGAEMDGEANAEWLLSFLGYDRWDGAIDGVCDYFRSFPDARPNLWLGASASTQPDLETVVPPLLDTPAGVRFLSLEPLLGPIDVTPYFWPMHWHWDAKYPTPEEAQAAGAYAERKPQGLVLAPGNFIDLVIVGAESGRNRRDCKTEWVQSIVNQCRTADVPCFVKQIHVNGKVVKSPAEFPQELPR